MLKKIISGLLLSLATLVVAIMQSSCFGSSISSTRSMSTYLQKNIYLNISLTIPEYNARVVFTNKPTYWSSRLSRINSNINMEPILLSSKCSTEILHHQTAIVKIITHKMILVNDLPHNRRNLRKTSLATSKDKIRSKKFHFVCPLKIYFPSHKNLKCRVLSVVELTPTAQNHNFALSASDAKLSSLDNMSTVFDSDSIVHRTHRKETWVVQSNVVHVIGMSGLNFDELFGQIQFIARVSKLPFDMDRVRENITRRLEACKGNRQTIESLKLMSDPFSSTHAASFLFPLDEVCNFAINPGAVTNLVCVDHAFDLVQCIDDPQIPGRNQKYIIQPWTPIYQEATFAGMILFGSSIDSQSMADCSINLVDFLIISKLLPSPEILHRVMFLVDRIRPNVPYTKSKKDSKKREDRKFPQRIWGLRIIVPVSAFQYADITTLRSIFQRLSSDRQFTIRGMQMTYLPPGMLPNQELSKEIHETKSLPHVIFCGLQNTPLSYLLHILRKVGITESEILDIGYTRSYGMPGRNVLPTSSNIVVRFFQYGPAIRLAQFWMNINELADSMSQLSRVGVIYGCDDSVPLSNQLPERELLTPSKPFSILEFMATKMRCQCWSRNLYCTYDTNKDDHQYRRNDFTSLKRKHDGAPIAVSKQELNLNANEDIKDEMLSVISRTRELFYRNPRKVLIYSAENIKFLLDIVAHNCKVGDINASTSAMLLELTELFNSEDIRKILKKSGAKDVESENSDEDAMEISASVLQPTSLRPDYENCSKSLSNGLCGYTAIAHIVMHYQGHICSLDSQIYSEDIDLLAGHLNVLANMAEMVDEVLSDKFLQVASLVLASKEQAINGLKELWLSIRELMHLMQVFKIPCRFWHVQNDELFYFYQYGDIGDFCYNIIHDQNHVYVHQSMSAETVCKEKIAQDYNRYGEVVGSIYRINQEQYDPEDAQINPDHHMSLFIDNIMCRCHHNAKIQPISAWLPDHIILNVLDGDISFNDAIHLINENVPDSIIEFYAQHRGFNQFTSLAQTELFHCPIISVFARSRIPQFARIAPVVGVLSDRFENFNCIPICESYIAPHMKFINPIPVSVDISHYMFCMFNEYRLEEMPVNISRYVQFAWPSLGLTANAFLQYESGVIWIRSLCDIEPGSMIVVQPDPRSIIFNMIPSVLLQRHPKPHPWRAIHFPSPAEYTVMQIKIPNETAEIADVEIISFPHNDSMEVLTIFENNSDIYNGEDMVFVLLRYCKKLCNYLSDLTAGIIRILRSGKNNKVWLTKVLTQSKRGFEKRTIGDVHQYRGLHLNSRGEICCYLREISKKLRNYRLLILYLLPMILAMAYYEIFKISLKKFVAKIATNKKLLFGKEFSSDNAGDGPSNEISNIPSTNMSQLLKIAAWNCNGHIAVRGGITIAEIIQKNEIDIMLLSDTRLDDRNSKAKVKQMRRLLPGYSIISFTTSRSSFTNRGGLRMNTMGGTMIVVAPWCAVKIKDTFQDSSGLGIAGGVSLILNESTYEIISMYQPIGSDQSGESTIISRLQKILHKKNISDSPKLFIGNTISLWIQRAYSKGHIPIVAGDFNADPSLSSGSYLRRWALDCGIISALHNLWKRRYFTHMAKGKPISSIDHIYVASSIESEISEGKIINSPMIQAESDHSVVAIAIRCHIRYITQDTALKEQRPSKRIELSHNNAAERNEFANLMDNWMQNNNDLHELTPSQKLHDIMVQSVQTTYHIKGKKHQLSQRVGPRSSFKDGYSPCYMALLAAYDLVLTYHNKALKAFYDNRLQIAREHMHSKFIALSHEWEKQYTPDMFHADEKNSASYHAARQVLFNIRLLQNISIDDLFTRATSLKNLMHGRLRSEMRQRTSSYLQKMEQLRQENKIGQLFSMVNLNDKQSLDLSTLNINGNVIKNSQDIHQKLSEHFTDWYATPDNLHAIAQKFLSGNFWQEIAEGKTSITSDRHPRSLRAELFENACKIKASPEQRQDILTLVSAPLSFEEYTREIKKMKSGKAPGPSGATANMFKAWSSEIHEEVFQNLNEIWLSNTIPDWWLKGHLRPIPKPGAPSLENLRPLGLYEISRKILTAIIIKRIYMAWEKYSLLNNQSICISSWKRYLTCYFATHQCL